MIDAETLSIENSEEEKEIENKIEDFKIFILNLNENTYELILEYWPKEKIIVELRQINILSYFKYKKVYMYEDLLKIFKLNKEDKKDILSLFNYLIIEIIPKIKKESKEGKKIKLFLDNKDIYLDLYEEKIQEKELFRFYYYKKCFGKMDIQIQNLNKELKEIKESLNKKINNLNEYNILLKKEKEDMEKNTQLKLDEMIELIIENKKDITKLNEDNINNENNIKNIFKENENNEVNLNNFIYEFNKTNIQYSNNIEEIKKSIALNKKNFDENKKSMDENKKNIEENKKKIKDINKKIGKNIKQFEVINNNIEKIGKNNENNKKNLECLSKKIEKNKKGIEDNKKDIKKLQIFNKNNNEDNKNNNEDNKNNILNDNKKKEENKLTIETKQKFIKKEIKNKKGAPMNLTPIKERENRSNKNKNNSKHVLTSKNTEKEKKKTKSKMKKKDINEPSKKKPEIKEKNNLNINNKIKKNLLKRLQSQNFFFVEREKKEEIKNAKNNEIIELKMFEKFNKKVNNDIYLTEENYEKVKEENAKRKKHYKNHLNDLKIYSNKYYETKRSHTTSKIKTIKEELNENIKSKSVNTPQISRKQSLELTKSQSTKASLKKEWKNNINIIKNFSLKSSNYLGYSVYITEHKHKLIYTDYLGKSLNYGKKDWLCAICGNKYNYDLNNFYCDLCEYDVCENCYEKKKQVFN